MLQRTEPTTTTISKILRSLDAEVPIVPAKAKRFAGAQDDRLHTARRVFSLIPLVVFLVMLALFAGQAEHSLAGFIQALLKVMAMVFASGIVCIGAYGFYSYLQDRSHGL